MARNPVFNEKAFREAMNRQNMPEGTEEMHPVSRVTSSSMTIQGTVNKTFCLLGLLFFAAVVGWKYAQTSTILFVAIGLTLVIGFIIPFFKKTAPYLAPLYAILEGAALGIISGQYNDMYQGIVLHAIAITFLVFGVMLFLYKTRIIKVTQGLIVGIVSATAAVAIFYLGSFVYSMFGGSVNYLTDSSPLSIGLSIVICIIATSNFLLDFHFIENMANQYNVPKYMEWYAAYGLVLTLVWVYIEILKLLVKSRKR